MSRPVTCTWNISMHERSRSSFNATARISSRRLSGGTAGDERPDYWVECRVAIQGKIRPDTVVAVFSSMRDAVNVQWRTSCILGCFCRAFNVHMNRMKTGCLLFK
jgi:hypothetical protein